MPITPEDRARIREAVVASNKRRGAQTIELRKARKYYTQHKANAKLRGVDFLLSYAEWRKIWDESGKWHERGVGVDKYCMSRYGDVGPYAVGNVFINRFADNTSEGVTGINARQSRTAIGLHGCEATRIVLAGGG